MYVICTTYCVVVSFVTSISKGHEDRVVTYCRELSIERNLILIECMDEEAAKK